MSPEQPDARSEVDYKKETAAQVYARLTRPVREFLDEPLPIGVGLLHTTGSMCLFMAALMIVTGILMSLHYVPSPDVAWESINYTREHVAFGRVIHGLHHFGSSAFVILACLHMLRVFVFGAYKGGRKWTWVVGVFLFATVLGFGFTGYLLPWDMKALFGTRVGTNIVGSVPIVGTWAKALLLGGEEISELTIPRFYAIHAIVLPAVLVVLIATHVYFVRLYGITQPWKRLGDATRYGEEQFFPAQALRDSVAVLILAVVLGTLAVRVGADLEAKADPTVSTYAPHPEWYFLGLQQILRYFTGPWQVIGTVIIPGGAFLALLALPFIDRNPERRLRRRPVVVVMAIAVPLLISTLTLQGYLTLVEERGILAALNPLEEVDEVDEASAALPAEPAPLEFSDAIISFGERLYGRLKCASCHDVPDAGHGANIPPGLSFVGDEFRPEWLVDYLAEVPPRRYGRRGRRPLDRMPDFKLNNYERRAMAAYLATQTRPELFEGVDLEFLSSGNPDVIAQGRELFETSTCSACHSINGLGGKSAPDLAGAASRLRPAFVIQMLKDPEALIPGTEMPAEFFDDDEIESLALYILSLQ